MGRYASKSSREKKLGAILKHLTTFVSKKYQIHIFQPHYGIHF